MKQPHEHPGRAGFAGAESPLPQVTRELMRRKLAKALGMSRAASAQALMARIDQRIAAHTGPQQKARLDELAAGLRVLLGVSRGGAREETLRLARQAMQALGIAAPSALDGLAGVPLGAGSMRVDLPQPLEALRQASEGGHAA